MVKMRGMHLVVVSGLLLSCISTTRGSEERLPVIRQLADLVTRYSERSPFDFLQYGCYCGIGGYGEPLDNIDRCCKQHDQCYNLGAGCKAALSLSYSKSCHGMGCSCSETKDECEQKVCQCDVTFAECLKEHTSVYNESLVGVRNRMCKRSRNRDL